MTGLVLMLKFKLRTNSKLSHENAFDLYAITSYSTNETQPVSFFHVSDSEKKQY